MNTKSFPKKAFLFTTQADISPQQGDGKSRRFGGVAYSGGVITDHGYWGAPIVFDLDSVTFSTPAPLLSGHNHSATVGVVDEVSLSREGGIRVSGNLFSGLDEEARAIADKADAGFPWQMSVGIFPGSIQEVPEGMSVIVNGSEITGPIQIFKNSRIREVSVVALGADSTTAAHVFEQGDSVSIQVEEPMTDQNQQDQNPEEPSTEEQTKTTDVVVEDQDTNDEGSSAQEELAAAKAELAALKTSIRKGKVEALFSALGRDMSDEAAEPYMGLSDLQFDAVSADLMALKPAASDFLSRQVITGGTSEERKTFSSIAARGVAQLNAGKNV